MHEKIMNTIVVILAIGGAITPMFFGFIYWKMSQMFVSKNDFDSFKIEQQTKHTENKEILHDINTDIKEILKKAVFK